MAQERGDELLILVAPRRELADREIGRMGTDPTAAGEGARLVVTNNTSTMHLLDALRVPGVVLFSGTELEEQAS